MDGARVVVGARVRDRMRRWSRQIAARLGAIPTAWPHSPPINALLPLHPRLPLPLALPLPLPLPLVVVLLLLVLLVLLSGGLAFARLHS